MVVARLVWVGMGWDTAGVKDSPVKGICYVVSVLLFAAPSVVDS